MLQFLKRHNITEACILTMIYTLVYKGTSAPLQLLRGILANVQPRRQRATLIMFTKLLRVLFQFQPLKTYLLGFTLRVKGKINRTGSVRKQQFKFLYGSHTLTNFCTELRFDTTQI